MPVLAIRGGTPVNTRPFPVTNTIGEEEKRAVVAVLDSGVLSSFRADPGADFLGGPKVLELERDWARSVGAKHAVTFNSLTSGLFAAVGAIGLEPGDEVIVSPYTMAASATCVVAYGGIPVFADIDPETLCLDPMSIEARVTPRTKAIIVVHILGHPADMDTVMHIARAHDLKVIEDAAQSPGGKARGRWVGTVGHIGGFSLNYHKTIHSGEGGVMVTDDDKLAERLRLIRNHGEVCVAGRGVTRIENTWGGNTRMTEMEAAVGVEQLKKLGALTEHRVKLAQALDKQLDIPGLTPLRRLVPGDRHVYYMYAIRYDADVVGVPRDAFVKAVNAEGVELRQGYVRPIYWEPMFQERIAFGRSGWPWTAHPGPVDYSRGLCPVTERMHTDELLFGKYARWPLTEEHVDLVVEALRKVAANAGELR